MRRNAYSGSVEELTPTTGDSMAAIPVLAALLATLARPMLWRTFSVGAVSSYCMSPQAWRSIVTNADSRPGG